MHGAEQASGYSPGKTQQNLAEVIDIADIAVKTGRQNMVEHGRIWQNTVDCRRLRQSCNQFLIAESVETGGRV